MARGYMVKLTLPTDSNPELMVLMFLNNRNQTSQTGTCVKGPAPRPLLRVSRLMHDFHIDHHRDHRQPVIFGVR